MPRHSLGTLLVALQFGLIGVLAALALPSAIAGGIAGWAWAAATAGVLLGLWSLACNPPGNFNIRPTPRAGGRLVRSGPYRWIRHPMYVAVMLCGLACASAAAPAAGRSALLALVAVLSAKASVEERWMLADHADYAEYQGQTWRFVPWLY